MVLYFVKIRQNSVIHREKQQSCYKEDKKKVELVSPLDFFIIDRSNALQ